MVVSAGVVVVLTACRSIGMPSRSLILWCCRGSCRASASSRQDGRPGRRRCAVCGRPCSLLLQGKAILSGRLTCVCSSPVHVMLHFMSDDGTDGKCHPHRGGRTAGARSSGARPNTSAGRRYGPHCSSASSWHPGSVTFRQGHAHNSITGFMINERPGVFHANRLAVSMQGAKPGQVKVGKESVVIGFPERSLAAGSEST